MEDWERGWGGGLSYGWYYTLVVTVEGFVGVHSAHMYRSSCLVARVNMSHVQPLLFWQPCWFCCEPVICVIKRKPHTPTPQQNKPLAQVWAWCNIIVALCCYFIFSFFSVRVSWESSGRGFLFWFTFLLLLEYCHFYDIIDALLHSPRHAMWCDGDEVSR